MGIHSGHRARVRQRFLQTGLNGFDDVNILEFLLFYAMPQQDTNPIAHALLDRFGSLHAVFEASVEELETVKGIGEYSAILLRLVPEICRRYMFSHRVKNPVLGTLEELYAYVIPLFAFHGEEHLFMLCLDSSNKVLDCSEIASGAADEVSVDSRKILEIAVAKHASRIVLTHNHPSGILIPSSADIQISNVLEKAFAVFGIELLDHIIVGDGECLSMRNSGFF